MDSGLLILRKLSGAQQVEKTDYWANKKSAIRKHPTRGARGQAKDNLQGGEAVQTAYGSTESRRSSFTSIGYNTSAVDGLGGRGIAPGKLLARNQNSNDFCGHGPR